MRECMGERRVCCSVACEPSESYSSSKGRCMPGVCGGGDVGCMAVVSSDEVARGCEFTMAKARLVAFHVLVVMASTTKQTTAQQPAYKQRTCQQSLSSECKDIKSHFTPACMYMNEAER